MKRSEFFSEMGKGFLNTVKEVSSSFLLDDLKKLDSFVDRISSVRWYAVGEIDSLASEEIHDFFIKSIPIIVIYENQQFQAFEKICTTCQMMPQWISYEKKFKCFLCDSDYDIRINSGELRLKKYPLKITCGKLYVGVNEGYFPT